MSSFATDSPLDHEIKKTVIMDTLRILRMSRERKNEYKEDQQGNLMKRLHNKLHEPSTKLEEVGRGLSLRRMTVV
jgi:hypothetical protein